MTFTPRPHATWNGAPPLRSGLAVERAMRGTLGVAVKLASGTYFTSARHVAGDPPVAPATMSVFRSSQQWTPAASLERLDAQAEPGAAPLLDKHDLSFLRCDSVASNVTPDGTTPLSTIGIVISGDELHVRGARHANWITTTFLDDFGPDYAPFFRDLPFDTDHLGVFELDPLGAEPEQNGNSGAVLWVKHAGGFAAAGHFVAASKDAPLGLIVQYRSAFQVLGLAHAEIVR